MPDKMTKLKDGIKKLKISRETNEDTENPLARPFHERVCVTDSAGNKSCNSFAADESPSLFGNVKGSVYDNTYGKGEELEGKEYDVSPAQEEALKKYMLLDRNQGGDYNITNGITDTGENCVGYSKNTFKILDEFLKKKK